jgi:hypothetical protein
MNRLYSLNYFVSLTGCLKIKKIFKIILVNEKNCKIIEYK